MLHSAVASVRARIPFPSQFLRDGCAKRSPPVRILRTKTRITGSDGKFRQASGSEKKLWYAGPASKGLVIQGDWRQRQARARISEVQRSRSLHCTILSCSRTKRARLGMSWVGP